MQQHLCNFVADHEGTTSSSQRGGVRFDCSMQYDSCRLKIAGESRLGTRRRLRLHDSRFRKQRLSCVVPQSRISVDNRELLTGDCLILISFCLYKQVLWRHTAFSMLFANSNLFHVEELQVLVVEENFLLL